MSVPIRRGAVYWIPDEAVELPPTPREKRNLHKRRPFLILSIDERNAEEAWPVVLGFPLSTSDVFVSEYDVELAAGKANLPDRCIVQVALLQAIAKRHILDRIGQLDANDMEKVTVGHLRYTGFID